MSHLPRFMDGAELSEIPMWPSSSGWGSTLLLESTIVCDSRKSFKLAPSGGTPNLFIYGQGPVSGQWQDDNVNRHCIFAYSLYVETLPGSSQYMYMFRHSDATINRRGTWRIRSDGKIEILGEGSPGGVVQTSTGALVTGKWYTIVHWATSGTSRVKAIDRITGVVDVDVSDSAPEASNRYVNIGCYWASYGVAYLDNFVMESDATVGNIDDPTNLLTRRFAIGGLKPTGVGTYDAWSGTYASVDDYPNDGDTTYRAGTAGQAFTQLLENMNTLPALPASVAWVWSTVVTRAEGLNANCPERLRSGATNSDVDEVRDTSTSYVCRMHMWTTDPNTASAWTVSAIDGLELGRGSVTDGTHRCTSLMLHVAYAVGPVERIRHIDYFRDVFDPESRVYDENGNPVPYDSIKPNRWMALKSLVPPYAIAPVSLYDYADLVFIEGVKYSFDENGETLEIASAPDDFVDMLIRRIASSSGSV